MTPETWAAVEILLWLGGIGVGLLIGFVGRIVFEIITERVEEEASNDDLVSDE